MSNRYVALENNLAALQDLIKRDPESYKDEFLEQYRHYENTLKLFQLQPDLDSTRLINVVAFLSQVAHCYPNDTNRLSSDLIDILKSSGSILDPHLRLSLCRCLAILRRRNLVDNIAVLNVFFDLCKCKDKILRKFVFDSTISFAKLLAANSTYKSARSSTQAFIFSKLNESHAALCRLALLLCIDLYRRRIWQDAKTANAISRACFCRPTKIFIAACKFFLGKDLFDADQGEESSDDDDDDNNSNKNQKSFKEIMVGYKAAKKTRKRRKLLDKNKEQLKRVEQKQKGKRNRAKQLDFSALHYLYDPQDFSERLFRKLETCSDRFEVKMILMALIARLVGVHKLQLLNFYPYLQKYLQPHQRDCTKILLFAAQSSHDLVPPDVIQALIKTILNNFISDRNSSEAITVGLNSVREIAEKSPLAIDEELLNDLVEYKKYKNKNVSMAAKGLIQTFREINPHMLKKRDRGKPTEAMRECQPMRHFAENRALPGIIPGTECLSADLSRSDSLLGDSVGSQLNDCDDRAPNADKIGNDSWEDEDDESDEDDDEEIDDAPDEEEEADSSSEEESNEAADEQAMENSELDDQKRVTFAQKLCETRIFTQEEFRKINAYQVKKRMMPAKGRKRKAEEMQAQNIDLDAQEPSSEEDDDDDRRPELTRLRDIEHLHKRPKQDKAARLESVKAGREGREKFGRPKQKGSHVGRTNRNLAKRKAFSMVKQKRFGKNKQRSFREKQQALRKYLMNQKKMR